MLDQAERERMWGCFEIEVKDGKITLLRKTSTEQFDDGRERTRVNHADKH